MGSYGPRERSRGSLNSSIQLIADKSGKSPFSWCTAGSGFQTWNLVGPSAFYEWMKDYENSRDHDGDLPVAPTTTHVKSTISGQHGPWKGYCGVLYSPRKGPMYTHSVASSSSMCPEVPSATVKTLCSEAFVTFNTQFPEEVSLPNFFWELGEIRSLLPRISRNVAKSAANGYLSLEFGWKPLLGDLNRLRNLMTSVEKRMAYLRKTKGRHTRVGFQRSGFYQPAPWESLGAGVVDYMVHDYRRTSYNVVFRSGGRLFHQMEYLDATAGYARALLGMLGLTNPAKVVWNAIPYSFIVDWIIPDIELLLDRFTNYQDLSSNWKVDRLSYSLTYTANVSITQRNIKASYQGTPVPDAVTGNIAYRRYVRNPGLLTSDADLNITSPTTRQKALLAALLTGKTK